MVLTSFSEGQPLVILEAYAWGVPVVATDVGACREMIEGRTAEDRAIGPSGFVTRVARPRRPPRPWSGWRATFALRWRMGAAGHQRVTAYYQRRDMLSRYRALYTRSRRRPATGRAERGRMRGGCRWRESAGSCSG